MIAQYRSVLQHRATLRPPPLPPRRNLRLNSCLPLCAERRQPILVRPMMTSWLPPGHRPSATQRPRCVSAPFARRVTAAYATLCVACHRLDHGIMVNKPNALRVGRFTMPAFEVSWLGMHHGCSKHA